jgi:NADPH:quinone reductase-like Zn-dependent oxidoreductase
MNVAHMMHVVRAHGRTGANLANEKLPVPEPGPGEVLVAVHATAVTADELSWPDDVPFTPCHDVSGTVALLGDGVTEREVGEQVYGLIGFDRDGAAAEYAVVPVHALAAKPRKIDHTTTAVIPLAGLTAWQALHEHSQVQRGQHVLVHGGAGGVGRYGVQLAHYLGARVTATAARSATKDVRALGADRVIDYTTRFEEQVADVDVVIDTVGGETLKRSWGVVRPGGTIVCIAEEPSQEQRAAHDIRAEYFIVEPNGGQLEELAHLVDEGRLRPAVRRTFPLDRTDEAFVLRPGRHAAGKVVVQVKGA